METITLQQNNKNNTICNFYIDIYAPYQPVLTTDILMPADFRGQQGYATSYGKKMVNSKMYIRGKIVG